MLNITVRVCKVFACLSGVALAIFATIVGGSQDHHTYFGGCGGSELPVASATLNIVAKYGAPLVVGLFMGFVLAALILLVIGSIDRASRELHVKVVSLRIPHAHVPAHRWARFVVWTIRHCVCEQFFTVPSVLFGFGLAALLTVRMSDYYCPVGTESYIHAFILTLLLLTFVMWYPLYKFQELFYWEHAQCTTIRKLSTLSSDAWELPLWSLVSNAYCYWALSDYGALIRQARTSKVLSSCLPVGFSLADVDMRSGELRCLIQLPNGSILRIAFGKISGDSYIPSHIGLAVRAGCSGDAATLYRVSAHTTLASCLPWLLLTYASAD